MGWYQSEAVREVGSLKVHLVCIGMGSSEMILMGSAVKGLGDGDRTDTVLVVMGVDVWMWCGR